MVLSDREIRAAIERGAIAITPVPNESDWTSTAIDLTLDYDIRAWKNPRGKKRIRTIVDPTSSNFNLDELLLAHSESFDLHKKPFVIKPHSFVLGWTVEKIRLPHQSRIAARVEGKSSLARLGLGVHVTAPTIHAGFGYSAKSEGNPIRLEIFNVGALPIKLTHHMKICQLIFEEVHGTPNKGYQGKFSVQGVQDRQPQST